MVEDCIGGDGGKGWREQEPCSRWIVVGISATVVISIIVVPVVISVVPIVVVSVILAGRRGTLVVVVIVAVIVVVSIIGLLIVVAIVIVVIPIVGTLSVIACLSHTLLASVELALSSPRVDQDTALGDADSDVGVGGGTHGLGYCLESDGID